MFALEARMISSRLKWKILPKIKVISMLHATMIRAYTSSRGACGGYRLARPSGEISVGEVLRVLEGGLEAAVCPGNESENSCQGQELCVARYVWKRINDSITEAVDTMMLSELLEESRRIKKDL